MEVKYRALHEEVNYFYGLFFKKTPSNEFIAAYIDVHSVVDDFMFANQQQLLTVSKIIKHRLSALYIEPWLRKGKFSHPLTAKLLLIMYLAECQPENNGFYRNNAVERCAFFKISLVSFKSIFFFIYGFILKLKYGLV